MFSTIFDDKASSDAHASLEYVVKHIFSPVYHPEKDDYTPKNAHTLACVVHAAARAFNEHIDDVHKLHWLHITKMLENLRAFIEPTRTWRLALDPGGIQFHKVAKNTALFDKIIGHQKELRDHIVSQLDGMEAGDVLVLPMPHYDRTRGVIFRKHDHITLYETVQGSAGPKKVAWTHPELAIEIPNSVFDDQGFRSELAGLLSGRSGERLTCRLRRAGHPVEPQSIIKHLVPTRTCHRGDVDLLPEWSRSDLWFLIRVAIQSSLNRSPPGHDVYKAFVLFLMYNIANYAVNLSLSAFLIHSMSAKILRRFRKLSFIAEWLRDAVFDSCTTLSQTLDQRRQELQPTQSSPSPWDPSQLDLVKDIEPSLTRIHEYISTSLADHDSDSHTASFHNHRPRSALNDFLSNLNGCMPDPNSDDSSPKKGHADIHITLYDVEQAVSEDIDEWVASVTDVSNACKQLEDLLHRYQSAALDTYNRGRGRDAHNSDRFPIDPDHLSIMLLTIIELWVALDKLVVKEIPILVDYSPEVPTDLLCGILLHDVLNIHRFCCAFRYISARHAQAHPGWSVFSDDFTEHSFPCRYYDNSPHLQRLKACIEDSLLPPELLHAKVAVFELQCPALFDLWRTVTLCHSGITRDKRKEGIGGMRVRDIPALRPYVLVGCTRPQVALHSTAPHGNELRYVYQGSYAGSKHTTYELPPSGPYTDMSNMQRYLNHTTHTSNDVLTAQANFHRDLPLHEFIAFAHLRSGGSLQWFNILRELRSRTLDFRRQEVYLLLAQASAQVGPFDSTQLLWHEELQDTSFCQVLLEELQGLFADMVVGSLDGPPMAVISLLASVLVPRSSREISEQAVRLLRDVRKKTFVWVHELLYDVWKSPNKKSLELLRDMAAVCRSSFDAGCTIDWEVFNSVQDIEIALSCAMLIWKIGSPASSDVSTYSQVLLNRNRRLSLLLERRLRVAIEADASDVGIDRAVQTLWPCYRPSYHKWKSLESPNSRWLVSKTLSTRGRRSQTVHVNLLDGSLLVDGRPIGDKLPSAVTNDKGYHELFGNRELMVIPSDLPGMDFVTTSTIAGQYVHFAVREDSARYGYSSRTIIRTQNKDTGDISEHVPRRVLEGDLPRSVIARHISWFSLSTSVIEIRPVGKIWEHSSDNWMIYLRSGQSRITKGGKILVNKRSPTWSMVSSRLRCLDDPENLVITLSPVCTAAHFPSLRLSVTLYRYSLSFFVNDTNDLESHDFKGMVYDEDQCIGTLFGLANRLILRPKTMIEADLIPKLIVIPHSVVVVQLGRSVHIKDRYPDSPAKYYAYQVDRELGCLKGISSFPVESRFYLARLHALTSNLGWRPDPLTSRTGVEEATSLIWLSGRQSVPDSEDWYPELRSPQILFASVGRLNNEWALPLRQEARLFPSSEVTIAAGVQCSGLHSLDQLLLERPPPRLRARDRLPRWNPGCHRASSPSPNIDPLRKLFSSLGKNPTTAPPFQSQYISRLHNSARQLRAMGSIGLTYHQRDSGKPSLEALRNYYVQCRANYAESLDMVKEALGPKTKFQRILEQCGQWPRVTPFILFRCLASTSPIKLSECWKKCLISLALLALDVQRARRLLRFSLDNLEEEFRKELENEECDESEFSKHPDWLLIQLQGDFLIRRIQADVAKGLMYPRSGKNVIMQFNMGEGKSSVIIPICAAILADGTQLVRIIVPKALVPQTFHLLTDRLYGLVNKPIYLLTFSRDEELVDIEYLRERVLNCRDKYGIIVMQPEHALSLKLACVEAQLLEDGVGTNYTPVVQEQCFEYDVHELTDPLSKSLEKNTYVSSIIEMKRWHRKPASFKPKDSREDKMQLMRSRRGSMLMEVQRLFETCGRDILDESDDVLRPQCQSIYATGDQHAFEGSPDRWSLVQQVLGLVQQHAYFLSTLDSQTIQCSGSSPGSFPHIHVLQTKGGEQLISLIAQDVLDGRLSSLRFHSELGLRGAIREFMLCKDVHPDTIKMVEKYARQSTSWGSLLLLRGLLFHNILLFVLTQRRWRVDYGLDPNFPPRTMLAIPYHAKDVPTDTAEFGHPDITILLTCLSYYYTGLSKEQLTVSFELLLQENDPASEYALWSQDCGPASIPDHFQKLSSVNIRSEQWNKYLFPLFSRNKRTIDLYLHKVVFAKDAKEFPLRISGSYWDIAEQKNHLVTGLSGTNDGHYLLPTSIDQADPNHHHQTGANAGILAYLLQPENSSYVVTASENGQQWTSHELLGTITAQNPQIRVLLDVGAQILDLTNLQLAQAWLDCTPDIETAGAIYFSEDDGLMVLERNGHTRLLSSSPFVQQLHRCVAYLDNAHTRGIDIKFPLGFRAAVTLGHKVTKDRLVQGCMRMRKLGSGHSVMFFAPREVDQRIRCLKEDPSTNVTTADILHWAIHETWSDIQRQAPYWAQQGMSHQSRYDTWSRFCEKRATAKELAEAWVQPEHKSFVDMYMPCHSPDASSSMRLPRQIRERCESFGVLSLRDVRMDEEQEREVSREIEREREVQKPLEVFPATHCLHPDVIQFVRTGIIPSPSSSKAFCHVTATGVSSSSELHTWSPYILATTDFCQTIQESEPFQGTVNHYLRPVQWVVSGKMHGKGALVLLSPFEVDQLMPEIKISEHVHLHLYIPRTTKRMKPADDLRLYTVPPLPPDWTPPWDQIDQLNIFAGQLYLSDYTSYVRVCRFLGVHTGDPPQNANMVVLHNWLSNPDSVADTEIRNRFEGTPLPLAMYLLVVRRGMDFSGTHMGRILDGWPLAAEDFDVSPDPAKSMTIGDFEQEQHRVPAAFISVDKGEEQEPTRMSRKRVSDSEEPDTRQPSKRRRPS